MSSYVPQSANLPRSMDRASEPEASRPRRILLVDDSPDVCDMLRMLLEFDGHQVRTALNGASAIDAARDYRPEIVLLDIGLPDITGYEVARRLRQLPDLSHSVLIALSGYDDEEDRQRSRDAGFDHYLRKPASLNQLKKLF